MRMKILVIGERTHFEECQQKFSAHSLAHLSTHQDAARQLTSYDVIFDFAIGEAPDFFPVYADNPVSVFLNTCRISLAEFLHSHSRPPACTVFGFNGLPTMLNREFLEVSVSKTDDETTLKSICEKLNTRYLLVDDRVGLVTPRVLCMIINEAYYALQEGTASRADIDLAMKLGTNYPYGPFEWCERIGLKNVYELLGAVYNDTKDERYKISALMKKEYLSPRPAHKAKNKAADI